MFLDTTMNYGVGLTGTEIFTAIKKGNRVVAQ
jgi:hypothetical protein